MKETVIRGNEMELLFAPLEGVTGYIYRNAHHKYYPGVVSTYYAPFISPAKEKSMTPRELRDIVPHNNDGCVVPQILTNNADYFSKCARKLCDMGYREINLNLGCPSGTVVAKGKGAGMLADLDALDAFLETVFEAAKSEPYRISVKTRIGKTDPDEFYELLPIFNRYPIEKLIVHPRIQKEFYKNKPRMAYVEYALKNSTLNIIYNGDLINSEDIERIDKLYKKNNKEISSVMIGRGLLMKPYGFADDNVDYDKLRAFHDELLMGYREIMSGDKNTLYRMKELWTYLIASFPDADKMAKQIRKCESMECYNRIVDTLFRGMK